MGSKKDKGKTTNRTKNVRPKRQNNKAIIVDQGNLKDIKLTNERAALLRQYEWRIYAELSSQRNNLQDEIKIALLSKSESYKANNFQRAVKYKYGLNPLSTLGSRKGIGGRFNIGSNLNQEFASFPALYLAEDKDTALQEHLGQISSTSELDLSSQQIALTNPASEVIVSVSVNLDKIFDLTNEDNLTPFISLIKNFEISEWLKKFARKLKIPVPGLVRTNKELREVLLDTAWRRMPMLYDLPHNSQIFGHLIYLSGIEGIVYRSKFTSKKCIAIFPENFTDTDSYITLDDESPHPLVPTHITSSNWELCEMEFNQIVNENTSEKN